MNVADLPVWSNCQAKAEQSPEALDPLEKFIFENEPANLSPSEDEYWRGELANLITHIENGR